MDVNILLITIESDKEQNTNELIHTTDELKKYKYIKYETFLEDMEEYIIKIRNVYEKNIQAISTKGFTFEDEDSDYNMLNIIHEPLDYELEDIFRKED